MGSSEPDLAIVPLEGGHDRTDFSCGVESLDRCFQTQAGQDVRRRANGVFVLADKAEPRRVLGYYTLCATALPPGNVPEAARKHIPRYPLVSATLIGRLAVAIFPVVGRAAAADADSGAAGGGIMTHASIVRSPSTEGTEHRVQVGSA